MTRPRREPWPWYAWLVMLVTIVTASGVVLGVSRRNIDRAEQAAEYARRQSEQVWCDVITVLDEAYQDPATRPSTELGRRIAAGIARVRAAYHC